MAQVVFDLSSKNAVIIYKSTMAGKIIALSGFGAGSVIRFDTVDAITAEAGADGIIAKWLNPAAGNITGTMTLRGSAPALFDILSLINTQWLTLPFTDGVLTITTPNQGYVATLNNFTFDSQAIPVSISEKIEDYTMKVSFSPPNQFSLAGSVAIVSALL
jgi:hypothetical protein